MQSIDIDELKTLAQNSRSGEERKNEAQKRKQDIMRQRLEYANKITEEKNKLEEQRKEIDFMISRIRLVRPVDGIMYESVEKKRRIEVEEQIATSKQSMQDIETKTKGCGPRVVKLKRQKEDIKCLIDMTQKRVLAAQRAPVPNAMKLIKEREAIKAQTQSVKMRLQKVKYEEKYILSFESSLQEDTLIQEINDLQKENAKLREQFTKKNGSDLSRRGVFNINHDDQFCTDMDLFIIQQQIVEIEKSSQPLKKRLTKMNGELQRMRVQTPKPFIKTVL